MSAPDPGGGVRWPAWEYRAALAALLALIVLRGFVFVWYEQVDFDSDQAIVGLMAKHLAEGRAFPLFQYVLGYLLAVEAWVAVPVFWIAGASVLSLKGTVLALNALTGWLLVRTLVTDAGLRPASALLAALFFVCPPPIAAANLTEALGGNIEPFLFVLLLWVTRRRPLVFGLVLGLGFLVREFTLYGLAALLLIEALDGALLTRAGLRHKAVALASAAAVCLLVYLLKPYSSPLGPGSVLKPGPGASSNVDTLVGMLAFDLHRLPGDLRALVVEHLPNLFGGRAAALRRAPINSAVVQGAGWLWPVLVAAMGAAIARAIWCLRRRRAEPAGEAVRFCGYLVLVGLEAALMYAVARGARMGLPTLRYVLLALLAPVGVVALYLEVEPSRLAKAGLVAVVMLWLGVGLAAHVRLIDEYARSAPPSDHRALANHLTDNGIKYGLADYWTAYHVVFLAREQVKLAVVGFSRIEEYERLYEAHRPEAVIISREPCAGGVKVRRWYLCPPQP